MSGKWKKNLPLSYCQADQRTLSTRSVLIFGVLEKVSNQANFWVVRHIDFGNKMLVRVACLCGFISLQYELSSNFINIFNYEAF